MVVSSAEDDYNAFSSAVKDLEYLRHLLQGLHIFPDDTSSPTVLVDSLPAIAMSQGLTHCSHTKHIDLTKALVRDYVQRERVVINHCSTDEQIADMWTKQNGQGLFVAYKGRFMGLVLSCVPSLVVSSIVSSR